MLENTWQPIVTRAQATECLNKTVLLPALLLAQRTCEQEAYEHAGK